MKSEKFMAGMNIEGDDIRESPKTIINLLKSTPIKWLRIHSLPTRTLEQKAQNKISYLDSIEYFCKNGYNIMAPIEVGYVDNVGVVEFDDLDKFIDNSYDISFKASKQIAKVAKKYKVKLILGIENEIDIKSWILQALPNIRWRASFETWVGLAAFQVGNYVNKILHKEKLPIHLSRYNSPHQINRMNPPERLALMFEEMGTSFVKFGQLLATRDDLIGPEYAAELSKLHDNMKPFPTEEAKSVIKEELGKPASEIFSKFDEKPMASASIGQVYRATLKNGKKVVIKVQRPRIEETIKEDIRIMHYLAYLADKNFPEFHRYDPQYLVDEFERSIFRELDFLREARNSERLRENFKDDKGVHIPLVYTDLSTKRVLTMEEIKGTKLTEIISSNSKTFNKKLIARRCLQAYLHMILIDGFYHADPHPGNIIVMDNDVICFLDFGRCATIDKELAESIFQLVMFAINNDANGLIAHLLRTNLIEESANVKDLKADLTDLLDSYYSPDIKNIKIGQMLSDLMAIISKYDFNRPREMADLTRTLLILEGAGTQLDPQFNVAEEFEPYAKKYLVQSFDPDRILEIIKSNLLDYQYIAKDFPSAFRRFMKKVSQGKITLQLEHKNLDVITANMKNMTDRMSVALILAALIVGSSAVGQINKPLGLLLFVVSAALGMWLVLKTLVF